ncbi:NTF2-like N-terminal transpeptidase domain-containing protein [Nocardia sp. NPDC005998]|uniref:NTF2-like N-terminal transpeptidase domain-containing protein n=1 Tax=Nocardia sp. NPDC005998 TaxID=3156894 RepID=UPI0033B6C6D1
MISRIEVRDGELADGRHNTGPPPMRCGRLLSALAAVVLAVGIGGCAYSFAKYPDDARVTVDEFTELLNKRKADNAANLTSQPNNAIVSLRQIFDGLGPGTPEFRVVQFIVLDSTEAIFTLQGAWAFGQDRNWSYESQGTVRKLATGWRISWDPTIVIPHLDNTHTVQLVRAYAPPPPIVKDGHGQTLMTEQTIDVVKLDPAHITDPIATTDALAKAIEPIASVITGPSLREQLAAAQGKPVVAVNLRESDFAVLEPDIAPIPGVVTKAQPRLIAADRRVQSPMLDALRVVWQDNRDRCAGWAVQLSSLDGLPIAYLTGQPGTPGPDVAATLDRHWQSAAQDAVNYVGNATTAVVINSATGAIVAAAENNAVSTNGSAFTGLAPIGGTTELLRTAAAKIARKAPQDVSVDEVTKAAHMLGIGVDFGLTGLDKVTSRIPTPGTEQVRRGGQASEIQASAYGMAIVAATIASGRIVRPMIEIGHPATASEESAPLPAAVVDQLRPMLGGSGYVAITGGQGWLLANMGELAFAIHVEDPDSSATLIHAAERILHPEPQPQ